MKKSLLMALLALASTGVITGAQAHENHDAAKPAGAAASAAPSTALAKPKRDPQKYFTDSELYTQDGRKVRFYTDMLKGRTVVINTIYTNCADACPLITQAMNAVRSKIGPAFGKDVFFITISSDPVRDTPQAMKQYAAKQSADVPGWFFLTGKKADVDLVLKRLGQWSQEVESHSTQLIAWNFKTDRGRKMIPNMPPDLLAAQISLLSGGDDLLPLPSLNPPRSN
ncbi:putative Cytochrome oxidase biogenesis protein Sco1/SenC/PrrC, copper metallochaperone [Rubrivivax sp. A210]|uniref:SCO family protein n=1 Tax=Rubrivivax sp. A210 TaxID=2772301 RepID=UPI001917DA0A|nr:SCO family protein [Rubrivivax sp. A210]CAD5369816.1 putative Cytochrome oxidase biogenesis protein Sco1/SenC/PrrC, copper metallochaperone [Rubrivivax sp. A210]